jgi:hypothetical protein
MLDPKTGRPTLLFWVIIAFIAALIIVLMLRRWA